jgi:hypothetical protein
VSSESCRRSWLIVFLQAWGMQDFGNGKVGVLNSKQGFTDSDTYVKLEKWLGDMFNAYWDENFDNLEVVSR